MVRFIRNHRFLAISALALALVVMYLFWARTFRPLTSDLEAHLELLWKIEVNQALVHVEFSPDGKVLAYRDDDGYKDEEGVIRRKEGEGSITLLDVDTLRTSAEKMPFTVPGEEWFGHDFQFTTDGLLAAKSNEEICFYDIDSREVRKRIPDPGGSTLTISPKGDMIAFFGMQKEGVAQYPLFIRNIDTTETIDGFLGIDCLPVFSGPAVFSPCRRYVACLGRHSIQVGDTRTLQRLHVLRPTRELTRFTFSPDSRYLAAVHNRDEVRLWDMSTGRMTSVRVDWRDAGYPKVIAFSPDGRLIASGGSDSTARESDPCWSFQRAGAIKLSDARTGALLFSLNLERRPGMPLSGVPRALAFSPDGKMLAVGLEDLPSGRVTLWKVEVREKAEE